MKPHNLNLRHLRAFREVARHNSVSAASAYVFLSQPAITQAISGLEKHLDAKLFKRTGSGMFVTRPGELFLSRTIRALDFIQTGARLALRLAPRKSSSGFVKFDQLLTFAQLRALVAVAKAGNFSLAARQINVSQPSLYRTARDLERLAGIALFNKTVNGIELTRSARALVRHAQLAFVELEKGFEEVENWHGRDSGRITIGTLPLARTFILPKAINAFASRYRDIDISVIDGPYDSLLHGLRHGELDMLIGALRQPLPADDIEQQELFSAPLAVIARTGHPLAQLKKLHARDLVRYPWVVPRKGTPTRSYFEKLFSRAGIPPPAHVIETSSLTLVKGLLAASDRLTISSLHQISHEAGSGLLSPLAYDMTGTARPIGITTRKNWKPTSALETMIDLLCEAGTLARKNH